MGLGSTVKKMVPSLVGSKSSSTPPSTGGGRAGEAMAKAVLDNVRVTPKAVHYTYTGWIIINNEREDFFRIKNITLHRDFVNNFANENTIEVVMDTEFFYGTVLSNLDNIEIYIKKKQMAENSPLFVLGGEEEIESYKGICLNPPKRGLGIGEDGTNKIYNPDQGYTLASFQLIEKATLELKTYKWMGMMHTTKPGEALAMILSGSSDGVSNGKDTIQGVHMSKPDNQDPYTILIPNGTYVIETAHLIQQQYGIYNFGIGSYLFKKAWFVYPLFNNARFEKEHYKLAISIIDKRHDLARMPRTFRIDGGVITIVSTEGTGMTENRGENKINNGTGIQVIDRINNTSDNIKKTGPHDNQLVMDGSKAVNTFDVVKPVDGKSNVLTVTGEISNTHRLISSVAGNAGTYLDVKWEFSNPDLLLPGMPVKIQYIEDGMKTLYGTLHEVISAISPASDTASDGLPYICNTMMRIYVTDKPEGK